MKLFTAIYSAMNRWALHPHAAHYLAAVCFIESSVFPIPPDVMLIPMSLAKPLQAWRYATIAVIWSVLGGVFGYVIGMFLLHLIYPYFVMMGYEHTFMLVKTWFAQWGFWAVLLAGCSPIPYKLFTIAAGAMGMAIVPFIIASIIGRGLRFYLVCGLIYYRGEQFHLWITRYAEWMGWGIVFLFVTAYFIFRYGWLL